MKVLIISPHFPPSNTADLHRVRLLLPYFEAYGWEAEVLAVDPGQVASPRDAWLEAGLPENIPVHRVQAMGLGWSRVPGLGTLGFRAVRALARRGDELLSGGHFDLVYFSTTVFEVHILGPRWKKKYGVPFVMDYQDPWVNDYYREHPKTVPPGGRVKFAVIDRLHRWMEPFVLNRCLGITSVSPGYPPQLVRRYSWLASMPSIVMPFPGDLGDFRRAASHLVKQAVFDLNDGNFHWVYIGRGGDDMATAINGLFHALKQWLVTAPREAGKLRFHFIGTSYAAKGQGRKTIEPLARGFGLAGIVQEVPDRIPYSETLRCLLDADALIVPGSNDSAYTASKIYPYLLARKPLLTVCHERSQVVELLEKVGGAVCIPFDGSTETAQLADAISSKWLTESQYEMAIPLDEIAFAPYLAKDQTRRLCAYFSELLANHT